MKTMTQGAGNDPGGSVSVRFPVAGTPIVHAALHGTWTVEAYLDDSATPCGPPAEFHLVD